MRPRRPQASRRVSRFVAPATPRSTRAPSVAQASDDGLEVVGGSPKTATGDRFPPRVVVLPPFLHVTALALQDPSASMSNMKSMATRLRTSKPRLPPVAGVPVVSSVQWFNVAITSTDTRPADGSASRPSAVAAILRGGEGVNPFPLPGIQSVRPSGPSGRREKRAPTGSPGPPPDGSPGPWEHKEGGHQRTRLPTRPSWLSGLDGGCPASRHAQPVNHGTSLSDPAATLATVSFHKVEHLCQVPLDGSDALLAQTCSASRRHERLLADRRRLDSGTGKSRAEL